MTPTDRTAAMLTLADEIEDHVALLAGNGDDKDAKATLRKKLEQLRQHAAELLAHLPSTDW